MTTEMVARVMPWAMAVVAIAVVALCYRWFLQLLGVLLVPQDSIAIVNKKFVIAGGNRTLPDGALIALNGEAGIQVDPLPPGVHYGYFPWQYEIIFQKFIRIPEDALGVVEAKDGHPLEAGRVLARHIECNAFQNARAFLTSGGERGAQIAVIPPGTYRINTALFSVTSAKQTEIPDNKVGVVTTMEGAALRAGDIAGRVVPNHNLYQNPQAFLDGGGSKGLQEQVVLAGRYFINPLFADVEVVDMTTVPIAHAGVVISYVGEEGHDVTGESFKHGNLVSRGQKGVWAEPLDPGKYPINPHTHKVENVPTANVVLNWATGKSEAHNLDKNLSTITVRSSDGFTFNLDVSQIIHIPRNDAPKVIARFGKVENLVTQVLEPTIGNYFRNAAQGSDVIDFLTNREKRQTDAREKIAAALTEYNVGAVNTLIGDITPPAALMKTLTDRKQAQQEKLTFETQKIAEETRKDLEQARATAATQAQVVAAERAVEVAQFDAHATVRKAEGAKQAAILTAEGTAASKVATANGEATATIATARAEAERLKMVGDATAAQTKAIGTAEADVIKLKIASMDSGNYAGIEIAKALSSGKLTLVPEIYVGGSGEGPGSLATALLATMLKRENGEAARPNGSVKTIDTTKK